MGFMQADHGPSEASIDLREYLGILRARKWAIILVALLTVAAAMAASYWQTPLYTGEARVLVNPLGATEPETTIPTVDVATES